MATNIKPSKNACLASDKFMKGVRKYSLGKLTTEKMGRLNLSGIIKQKNGTVKAIKFLANEEISVYKAVKKCERSGEVSWLTEQFKRALMNNGRIVFLGAGAKFREAVFLEREWRNFINGLSRKNRAKLPAHIPDTVIGMGAGGDLAQIRTAEGMEDIGLVAEREIEALFQKFKKIGVRGPIVVVGHDSSGNSLYTVRAVKKTAQLGQVAVFAINNPAREVRRVSRINDIIRDKRIKKIHFKTDPPPIAGSTRLQPTTAGMVVFGLALSRAFVKSFPKFPPKINSKLLNADISKKILEWTNLIRGSAPELAKFVNLKARIYWQNSVFSGQGSKDGYLTFLSGSRAFLPVLTNEVEEYPTFGTPPYATLKELERGAPLSPSGILVEKNNGQEALETLFGRQPRDMDLKKIITKPELIKIYGNIKKIPDLSKKRLAGFCFDYKSVWKIRPTGKGNMVVVVLMGDDVVDFNKKGSVLRQKLISAKKQGAKTAIIAVTRQNAKRKNWPKTDVSIILPVENDALSVQQSVVLKTLFNIQSNVTMVKMNKIYGSLMLDVAPSNGKLIDRATRYVVHACGIMLKKKVNYRAANRYLFEALEYIKKAGTKGRAVSSPVKLTFIRIFKKVTLDRADQILKKNKGDLDTIVKIYESKLCN